MTLRIKCHRPVLEKSAPGAVWSARKYLLVQFWAFLGEIISEVSLQNCDSTNKVHRGGEIGEGGGLPGGRLQMSRGLTAQIMMMSWSLGCERTKLKKMPEGGLNPTCPC